MIEFIQHWNAILQYEAINFVKYKDNIYFSNVLAIDRDGVYTILIPTIGVSPDDDRAWNKRTDIPYI